ncbi:MAG: redoxin domain-containing protein [Candidatus Aminicenantes bacterium]|nr:redoxin domain-containing protein [Candidatus Aminicenantes bacterium]
MKRILVALLVLGLFFFTLCADEKEVIENATRLLEQKDSAKALQVIEEGIKTNGFTRNLMRFKFIALFRLAKYDEAIAVLDEGIKKLGENQQLLMQKIYILMRQEKFAEALKIALRKDEISKKKSPWDSMDLVELYLKLKDKEKAFEWLQKAVDRGFNSLRALESDSLKLLAGDPRLKKIVAKIKDNIGLEKTAKDFTVKLLSGETFQLSKQKGKVMLIDFWAVWCGPCKAEIPNLKKYYAELKDKGFEIIGISLDRDEKTLKDYLKQQALPWKISYSGAFWNDKTAALYGVKSIPSYWLVDKKGILRYVGLRGEALKKAVEELLAEK